MSDTALTPQEEARDSLESYNAAVRAISVQVQAGAPVPAFYRGRHFLPGRLSATAFELPDDLPFELWRNVGATLRSIERSVLWWVGDWLRFGERHYGDKYTEALGQTDYSYQTLANAKTVAGAFEFSRRRENLPWSHHAELTSLSIEEQDGLLDQAEVEGWSQKELRAAVHRVKNRIGSDAAGDTCRTDDLRSLIAAGQQFGTIYADPPWLYGNQATRAATGNHYGGMSVDDIAALPIADLAAPNAHLHLWTTNGFLFESRRIMEAWGFEYKSCFVWVKPGIGTGNYWRLAHEFMLFGVRGSAPFQDRSLISWGEYERGPHSTKPAEIRELIEKASPGPRLELFARRVAAGWTVWGDNIERDLFFAAAD